MKNNLVLLLVISLLVSCGFGGQKKKDTSPPEPKYIAIVDDVEGYHVAYTEDGHTMIFENDSVGNYIVYYVKFDNNAGKFGLKGIEEKIIRAEIDSSLNTLRSFVTFKGGVFCEPNDDMGYDAYYFDNQLKGYSKEHIEFYLDSQQADDGGDKYNVLRIISLLNVAYQISQSINNDRPSGWDKTISALEPVQNILGCNIISNNTNVPPRVKEHVSRISRVIEEFTYFYHVLEEKKNNSDV